MPVKTTKKTKEHIAAETRAKVAEQRVEELKREVSLFITGLDELFKSRPSNQEVGSTLAMMVQSLEKAVND